MENEKVLLKIKKLLALSNSSFEAEAASAAAKASELMLAYGLQAAQIPTTIFTHYFQPVYNHAS